MTSGGLLAASDNGDLFIAWQTSGGYEVKVFRPGVERSTKGVLRVPGTGRSFAIDPTGTYGAAVTDQGTYRFSPHDPNPGATLQRVATGQTRVTRAIDSPEDCVRLYFAQQGP